MEAKELRIGNWVIGRDSYPCNILDYDYLEQKRCDNYNPIPLTIEILEKAGFNYSPFLMIKWRSFVISVDVEGILMLGTKVEDGYSLYQIKNIKYLHQLQNLYFALTGEELKINL